MRSKRELRILEEFQYLRNKPYDCKLLRDSYGDYIRVNVNYDQPNALGHQQFVIWVQLGNDYPRHMPGLIVETVSVNGTAPSQPLPLDVDSDLRIRWTSDSKLDRMIGDVIRKLQAGEYAPLNEPLMTPENLVEVHLPVEPPKPPPSRRAVPGRLIAGAVGLISGALLMFGWVQIRDDPCADLKRAAIDATTADEQMRLYEALYAAGATNTGRSCVALFQAPRLLVQLHMQDGERFAASGQYDRSQAAYLRAAEISAAHNLSAELRGAQKALSDALWAEAADQWASGTEGSEKALDTAVATLTIIQALYENGTLPEDLSPKDKPFLGATSPISASLALYTVRLRWGDLLYQRAHERTTTDTDPAETSALFAQATEQYEQAGKLLESTPEAARASLLGTLARARQLILQPEDQPLGELLPQLAAAEQAHPELTDAAQQKIGATLFDAYLAYGHLLMQRRGYDGVEAAIAQEKAARALIDKGIKPERIEGLQQEIMATSPYTFAIVKANPADWPETIKAHLTEADLKDDPNPMLIVTGESELKVILYVEDDKIAERTIGPNGGAAFTIKDGRTYRIGVDGDLTGNSSGELDFSNPNMRCTVGVARRSR